MSRRKREITGLMNEWDFPHLLELALPGRNADDEGENDRGLTATDTKT